MADNPKRDAADVQFKKAQRADDGKKAMSEYEAEAAATRAKTERLRALRMARDAAAGGPPAKAAKAKPAAKTAGAKKAPAKRKAKAAPLSGYLKDQEEGGRDS